MHLCSRFWALFSLNWPDESENLRLTFKAFDSLWSDFKIDLPFVQNTQIADRWIVDAASSLNLFLSFALFPKNKASKSDHYESSLIVSLENLAFSTRHPLDQFLRTLSQSSTCSFWRFSVCRSINDRKSISICQIWFRAKHFNKRRREAVRKFQNLRIRRTRGQYDRISHVFHCVLIPGLYSAETVGNRKFFNQKLLVQIFDKESNQRSSFWKDPKNAYETRQTDKTLFSGGCLSSGRYLRTCISPEIRL